MKKAGNLKKIMFRAFSWGLEFWVRIRPEQVGRLLMGWFTVPRTAKAFSFPEGFQNDFRQGDFTLNDGHQVAFYDWGGQGPKILLLHGWESNASRWHDLAIQLVKEGYAPIAIDAPAHGKSTGEKFTVLEYGRWLEELVPQVEPFAVVGHSAGGMAILVASKTISKSAKKAVVKATPAGLESLFDYFRRLVHLGAHSFQSFELAFEGEFGKPYRDFTALDYIKGEMPSGLILHDQLDEVIPEEEARLIAQNWKNADLVWTRGLGHSQKSPEIYQRIIDFLKEK